MKLAVCIKQVPRLDQVRFHERTNRIVREDVEAMINPLDIHALGHALALRDAHDGEIVAVTMGPPAAREALQEALARGADSALHLVDRRFAGADTLATARTLAQGLERVGADLVLFGRSTLDGATGQVPPQVAELAGLPYLTHAVDIESQDGALEVLRETERGFERWRLPLPSVVSVERGPDPPEASERAGAEVTELTADDLGGGPRDYGTRGSPTFVKEVRELSLEREAEHVEGAEAGAERLAAWAAEPVPGAAKGKGGDGTRRDGRAIWVLAERDGEDLHPVSAEGVGCAREVAGALGAEVVSVLLCDQQDATSAELAGAGADRVLLIRDDTLGQYAAGPYADALCAAIEQHEPFAVIAPWTTQGREYVPRAAARLGLGLTGDFVGLEVDDPDDDEPDLLWRKPAWAGTVEASIIAHTTPSVGTLRPGVFTAPSERDAAPVQEWSPEVATTGTADCVGRTRVIEDSPLLDCSPTIVLVGAGLGEEGVAAARRAARALGGSVGATRAAVDAGLAPAHVEVDVVKRTLAPLLVVAMGVREPAELDALRAARRLATVHPDTDAPVHERADLAIAAGPDELCAALVERIGAQ